MRKHLVAEECWCKPKLAFVAKYGTRVWVHNAKDGRDPPDEVVAEAVAEAMDNDDGGDVRVRPLH